jgi:hypothetical protein
MASAKDIVIKPISAKAANDLVKRVHYSGKVVQNSSLHFGAFLDGRLEGVMSFGSPMDKRKVLSLVEGTSWNGMLELNRMAFSDQLPRNSESRCLAISFKLIRKHYPHIEWILSFSDGAQCGDGTIYRASGFVLTQIKENSSLYNTPSGVPIARMTWDSATPDRRVLIAEKYGFSKFDASSFLTKTVKMNGMSAIQGFQLRYVYFLNPAARQRLTVPILPFSKIDEMGAGMYKGVRRGKQDNSGDQFEIGGAAPTTTLQSKKEVSHE